jgi:SAM-dependent methyltransferase
VSKPDDHSSRTGDGKPPAVSKVGARVRTTVPRERSGPIGISSGDFATPVVRKRTTTQPRGLPVVGGPAPTPTSADTSGVQVKDGAADAPPAPLERTNQGAVPVDLVDAPAGAQRARPPAPTSSDDSPFVAPAPVTAEQISEAAALAAEAAAVRALDSGPLTPPPELSSQAPDVWSSDAPAPSPEAPEREAAAPAASAQASEVVVEQPTPPPEAPSQAVVDTIKTPTPAPAPFVASAPQDDASAASIDLEITPPPEVVPPAPASAVAETPPPEPAAGAVPAQPMSVDGSGSRTPDLPVEALTDPLTTGADAAVDGDIEGADHLELEDAPDTSGPHHAEVPPDGQSRDGAPPRPAGRSPTPPPIPGAYLKTPGPEPLLPGLPILPEALAQRPRRPKRSKPWFEEVFDEDYLRTLPFMRAEQTLHEVEFISEALRLSPSAEVLDVACGYGRHAIELVQRGFNVTGLDLSLPLLIRAADEAQRRALSVNFVHADMREMAFEKQFDGAYCMLTSFGYFDEEANLRVIERIARALKPGARFLLDVVNRDYLVSDLPLRVWWEGTGCVVLEEVDFNFHTSRILTHRSIVFEDGRQLEQEISVRAYSLHEVGRLLRQAGFKVVDVSGSLATRGQFFGSASRNLFVIAEKRDEDAS